MPEPGEKGELVYPAAQVGALPNGLAVYHLRRPSGLVSFSVVVRGGAVALADGQSGLSAFTARMMTEGTKTRSSFELSRDVEALGSSLEHEARRDVIRLGLSTLREDFDRGLSLLADVVQNPAFHEAEVTRVRAEWLDSLEGERQDPSRLASLAGLRLLLGARAGAPVSGGRPDVARLGGKDLRRFHREYVVPKNAALIVAGDLDFDEVLRTATRAFGNFGGGAPPAARRLDLPEAPSRTRVVVVDRPGAVQSAVFAAQRLPRRGEPGFEARELLNNVIGGLFTSRLNANLRETHAYTYGVRSAAVATRDFGAFVVMTSVRTDATADALRELVSELEKASTSERPITEEELGRARADLIQRTAAGLQRTGSVRDDLEQLFTHSLAPDYLSRYPTLLADLKTPAIQAEAQRLTPKRLVVAVVGDRAKIEKPLAQAGFAVEAASDRLLD